jgi:hypothetical protein
MEFRLCRDEVEGALGFLMLLQRSRAPKVSEDNMAVEIGDNGGLWERGCWCFDHRLINLAPRFSMAQWLTNEGNDLDWFERTPYIQRGW